MTDGRHPADLREALSVIPLLHLIPRQDIAPIIAPNGIVDSLNDLHLNFPQANAENIRESGQFNGLLDELITELRVFDDEELQDLKFKEVSVEPVTDIVSSPLSLPPFERRILDDVALNQSVIPQKTSMKQAMEISRLSVRKNYNDDTKEHNKKYIRKFNKELQLLGIQKSDRIKKRPLEDAVEAPVETPKAPRIQKSSYLIGDLMLIKALNILNEHLNRLCTENTLQQREMSEVALNLHAIYTHQILHDLDVNLLLKLQEHCMDVLVRANKYEWGKLDNSPESLAALKSAINPIHACKILILILNSSLLDRQLFVGDYLQIGTEFMATFMRETLLSSFQEELISEIEEGLGLLSHEMSGLFTMIAEMQTRNISLDEHILTRLEYLSVLTIFTEANRKSGPGPLNAFENLRASACNVLVKVFTYKNDQREFILNEIMSCFDKLPIHKNAARQLKVARGGSIQYITGLLVNFVEGYDPKKLHMICEDINQRSEELHSKDILVVTEEARKVFDESEKTANEISAFIVGRFNNGTDTQTKSVVEMILEDLVAVLPFPEWLGSVVLLLSLWRSLMMAVRNQSCSAQAETYFLEMSGIVAEKILVLRNTGEELKLSSDSLQDRYHQFNDDTLSCLEFIALRNRSSGSAVGFFSIQIIMQLESLPVKEQEQWEIILPTFKAILQLFTSHSPTQTQKVEHSQKITEAYTNILLGFGLNELYETFMRILLSSLESTKIKTKTRAIKILSTLIEVLPQLILSPYFQESISNRLTDTSPLVRDAVLDLISKYLSLKPEVIEGFYQQICTCLNDASTQVKKRVMKLSRDIYIQTNSKSVMSDIASKVLRKVDDKDTAILEMAINFILFIWFDSSMDGKTWEETAKQFQDPSLTKIEVLTDVLHGNEKSKNILEFFVVNRVLKSTVVTVRNSVASILEKALDHIIELSGEEVDRSLYLVSSLVKCDGSLISQDQLVSIMPFLMTDTTKKESTRLFSLQILNNSLRVLKSLRPDHLNSIQDYLLQHLTKFTVQELHEAMPCVWRVSEIKGNTIKIANATVSTLRLLRPFIDSTKQNVHIKFDPKLQKLLHLLGCFGQFCKFEKHRDIFSKSFGRFKDNESVVSVLVKFILYFSEKNVDVKIRCVAIKNLIRICTTHPKLFLSDPVLKVFDTEFRSSNDLIVIHGIIQGIVDFLNLEDTNTQKRNGIEGKSSANTALDIGVFHGTTSKYVNDGICAGLVQRYIGKILEFCLYDGGSFSQLPIKFLQLVIKLGFVNPKMCIPTILALESSNNRSITTIAHDLHQEIYERHESLAGNNYIEAIKIAAAYRKRVSATFLSESEYFQTLYSVVNGNYSSKKKFVSAISKIFLINVKTELDRDTILYSIQNMARLKYSSMEEVLMVIHGIDNAVSTKGMDLLESNNHDDQSKWNAQVMCTMIKFRGSLIAKFGIPKDLIEDFRPGKTNTDLRQTLRSVNEVTLGIDLYFLTSGDDVFKMFSSLMEEFT